MNSFVTLLLVIVVVFFFGFQYRPRGRRKVYERRQALEVRQVARSGL